MRFLKGMAVLLAALALAACGGGKDSASSGTTTPQATAVEVVANATKVGTGGEEITVTAVVKGAGNVAMPNTALTFNTDTGNLTASSATTDSVGAATAKFSAGQDRTNRNATITVTSGGATGTLVIPINGTTLTCSGPRTLSLRDSANQPNKADFTIKATDSSSNPIANLPIEVTGTLGNVPAGTKITTGSAGTATLTYTATVPGSDLLKFTGVGGEPATSQPCAIDISGEDFKFTAPAQDAASVNIGASQNVSVSYRVNGAPPTTGLKVRFAATAGSFTPASATTGVDLVGGDATVQISSNFAGPATIQATVFDPASPNTVVAQASRTVQFVATTPKTLVLQVTPTAIGPNPAGSSTQQSEVRATVRDRFGNPVTGVTVNFSRISDPSGGNLSSASDVTNPDGVAKVQYISGAQSTQTGGVKLHAEVAGAICPDPNDPNPASCPVSGDASLTVNQSALFIALGTGNTISNVNETTYRKTWTVYVTDATGAPVPNVTLTISALPKKYGKGSFAWTGKVWASFTYDPLGSGAIDGVQDGSLLTQTANKQGFNISCPSEDTLLANPATQNNGVLDPGEDVNNSGKLEPGNVISVNGGASVVTLKTDSTGFALVNLQYAESYAYWVQIGLKASATVAGTESSNEAVFWAEGLASDYSNETVPPAGLYSPFGVRASCTTSD